MFVYGVVCVDRERGWYIVNGGVTASVSVYISSNGFLEDNGTRMIFLFMMSYFAAGY